MPSINGNTTRNATISRPFVDVSQIIYLNEDNKIYTFDNNIMELKFNLYRKYGSFIDFTNNIFNSTFKKSQKILIEVNIFYKWFDSTYPSRFYINVFKNDILYISHLCGIADSTDINNIYKQFVIDILPTDKINIFLKKNNDDNNLIEIIDNSYYSLKTFTI